MTDASEQREVWPLAKRIGFRFVFLYVALYCFPEPLYGIPGVAIVAAFLSDCVQRVITAAGRVTLGVDLVMTNNGSGDTTANYFSALFFLVTAMAGTALWSLLDRNRLNHRSLWRALHVYVRYVVAATMLLYGFEKVFLLQFPAPSPVRLSDTFGDASPMGLMWAFMGASPAYQFAAGALEVAGGTLLLFKRTATLGALMLVGVMSNVVLLDFCYDVSAKLPATHLLLMTMLLVLPDFRRLANVLVLQRPTEPEPRMEPRTLGQRRALYALKAAVIASFFYTYGASSFGEVEETVKAGALDGVWDVGHSEGLAPLPSAPVAWRRFAVTRYGVRIRQRDGTVVRFKILDQDEKTLRLSRRDGEREVEAVLSFESLNANEALLTGVVDGDPIRVQLTRIDTSKALLLTRGFHWISEEPFNR